MTCHVILQVLTPEELSLLDADDIQLNKLARAKFDFNASSDRELSLVKVSRISGND